MVVKIRLDDKNTSCKGLMFGRRWRCWAFDLVGVQKVSSNRFSRRLSCLSSVQIYNTTKLCGGCFFPCSHLWLRAIKTLFKVARNIAGEKKKSKSHKSALCATYPLSYAKLPALADRRSVSSSDDTLSVPMWNILSTSDAKSRSKSLSPN